MDNENRPALTGNEIKAALHHKLRESWHRLISNTRSRHFIGSAFSILCHVAVIAMYLGLASLEQPELLEIREITFVDETIEQQTQPTASDDDSAAEPENERQADSPTFFARNSKNESPPTEAISISERLDMPRRQAPINLSKSAPIVLARSNSDVLNVSPAHGTRTDNQILNPTGAIKLERQINLQPTKLDGGRALDLNNSGKPGIVLSRNEMRTDAALSNQSPASSGKPLPRSVSASLSPKTTSTVITGQLADREIVNKIVPSFPAWARKRGVGASVALSFAVMENGRVKENVIVVQTSGSSQWDEAVIAALKKWRFAALDANQGRQDQTGVIVFQFVIE